MDLYRFNSIPTLETERTLLRQLYSSDAQEIFMLRSNTAVNEHIDREPATTIEDGFGFIKKIKILTDKNESFYWAITLKGVPALAGAVTLWNFDAAKDKAEIGYELLPEHHGKGIMEEVMKRVLDFAFNSVKIGKLEAWVKPSNERSIHLLDKLGFKRDTEAEASKPAEAKEIIYSLSRSQP
ncbi:MAG: GCN5-related N-acetyltransferase [Chitinophagaceae bacterium]|jgi:ribosomal-protein-alanine N-acetyltransferase|nr:GCN5-related N-acetyltransferase [Chitinophagaceae bacterium]